MKLRKAWLSLLLALAMVVTMLPAVAFAEQREGSESQYTLSFDPEGTVNLYAQGVNYKEVEARLWDSTLNEGEGGYVNDDDWVINWTSSDGKIVVVSESSYYDDEDEYEYVVKDGIDDELTPLPVSAKSVYLEGVSKGTATVTATASVNETEVASSSFTVNVSDPEGISVGQTKSVTTKDGEGAVFVFKPSKTAHYIFYSQGSGGESYDPEGDMSAPDDEEYPHDDLSYWKDDIDSSAGNMNFEFCFPATAGHTYYLYAYPYDSSEYWESGEYSFTVGLKYGPKEQAEEAIASANALPAVNYKPDSYSKVIAAKQYLENLMKDPKATAEQILAASDALKAAISNLQPKAANTLAVKSVNKSYKARKMNKKKVFKAVTIKNRGQGALSYAVKPVNKKSKKALSFNKKNGKITVKKGTKKGVYKMVVTIKTAGNNDYLPGQIVKTITVKVKK